MALDPDEQETQIVPPLHSPPPEQQHLDDAFPGGADGYHTTGGEQGFDNGDGDNGSDLETDVDHMVMDTQPILQQTPPQNLQQESNTSFIEETQFADIEPDTQAMRHQDQSFHKEPQNNSFGSQSFIGETQYAEIELDTQATEDATQFIRSDLPSQRQVIQGNDKPTSNSHPDMSPARYFSKPVVPDVTAFRFSVAKHIQNREPTGQNPPTLRSAAQPEIPTTELITLPKVTPTPDPRNEPSTNHLQPTRQATARDHTTLAPSISGIHAGPSGKPTVPHKQIVSRNASMEEPLSDARSLPPTKSVQLQRGGPPKVRNLPVNTQVPDVRAVPSVKPSVQEKEMIPIVQNITMVEELADARNLPSMNSTHPARKEPPKVSNNSVHHQSSDFRAGSSVEVPIPEKEARLAIHSTPAVEQSSNVHNLTLMNPAHPPRRAPPSSRHKGPDAHTSSSRKATSSGQEARSVVQNNSAANPLIRIQTKHVVNPLFQTDEVPSTSHGIFSQSASHADPSKDTNASKGPNKLSVIKASRNEQSKPLPFRQDNLAPIHGPQRARLRQKSSNQLKRFPVKTNLYLQGNLVKRSPFPEADADQPKAQVHRDRTSKNQVPPPPQYPELQSAEKEIPTRSHATAESLESRRLPTNNIPTQLQENTVHSMTSPVVHPIYRSNDLNTISDDSIMTSVEYDILPEDSRQSHQFFPVSQIRPDHHVTPSGQHPSTYREPSQFVSRANMSRPQSRVDSSRPQPMVRTQAGHQTNRTAMNRPIPSHDLEPQGVSEGVLSGSSRTKVSKAARVHSRNDDQMSQVGDHINSQHKIDDIDVSAALKVINGAQRQQEVVQIQQNDISYLYAKLEEAETKLHDKCVMNAVLEAKQDELSKRVEKLNILSNKYREHINDVVVCQKSLKQESIEMKSSMTELKKEIPPPNDIEIKNRDDQSDKMRKLLEEIKQAQNEQIQRDSRNAQFETLTEQIGQLERKNEILKADVDAKLVELRKERYLIEQLQKQISSGELDRHKEVMEILQKPQVDTLGELTKEDGILRKVLNSSEGVQTKFEGISKAVTDAVSQTSEWPQKLTKSFEEFYSRFQTKLDENGTKDTTFQESTVKLFDDLKERLKQVNGDLEEKTKLSEQLNLLRENNATLKANLDSKEVESKSNVARLNELARELTDIRSQLMNKTEQLAISTAQPREDPEMKRKVDDLTAETSRLQSLLTTANNDKLRVENTVQTYQATITAVQTQLRETEDKLRSVEVSMKALEGDNQKFKNECRLASERVRQETTQLALSHKKELITQHDTIVNDLMHKQAKTEKSLQAAVEESKTSKKASDEQAKTIGKLESEIAAYKDQLLQQKLQLQNLEESSISAPLLLKQNQEHKKEIQSIRQEQANQHASSQAFWDESLKIKGELESAQKRLHGINEENEQLKKENDRLRQRMDSINAMAESSQRVTGFPSRTDDSRSSSRRVADRRFSNVHTQRSNEVIQGSQRKAPDSSTSAGLASASSRSYGDKNDVSQTPIKPFSTIASSGTSSPLTDLDDIMPKVQSANNREELQQVYNNNRLISNDKNSQKESGVRSKYHPHGERNVGTPTKLNNAMLATGDLVCTSNQAPRTVPSVAQESIQRRTSKPLKSAMKKGDHQNTPITLDSSQDQVHTQKDESSSAIFKKPALKNNRGRLNNGLQAISGAGANSYNRIASGKPNISDSMGTEEQPRSDAPLYEPTPEIKRNAMKRARSNSAFGAQALQSARPAKAPRINLREPINKTVIPDSQDRS